MPFESESGEDRRSEFLEPGDMAPKNRLNKILNRVIITITDVLIRWKALYQVMWGAHLCVCVCVCV